MQIIVNDTSCLIDLRKAGLLRATLLLPFIFQIPLPLIHAEFLDFTQAEIEDLVTRGLKIIDVPSEGIGRALTYRSAYPGLSFNDCLSMALAASQSGSILLTGDQSLRNRASAMGIEVHGVLWVSDQLQTAGHITFADLHKGLLLLQADPVVFLPKDALVQRIARLHALLTSNE
jgi:hypothetical protein